MAEFLTTTDTSAAIERVIRGAEKELTMISAYVYPRVIYLQRLKDAADRGVNITFIFGKKRMDDRVFALFKEIPNLKIYYLDELHAKCFVNEREAIVTSLNLLNGSEEKNREMGVRLDRDADAVAYQECVNEVRSILAVATLVKSTGKAMGAKGGMMSSATSPMVASPKGRPGYCIRTGARIPFNMAKPLCYDAFLVWSQFGDPDYPEQYCHFSGEPSHGETCVARPILKKNWKKAKEMFNL